MIKVYAQITAFDKHSNNNTGRSIVADTKESFNKQVEEFENDVEYSKFYTQITLDDVLTPEQEIIVEDHEVIKFAQETFGADENGMICIISQS